MECLQLYPISSCGRQATRRVLTPAVLCLLGLSGLLPSASGSFPHPDPQRSVTGAAPADSLQAGIQLIRQQRYQEAEGMLLEAVKLNPSSAQAYFYLGIATLKLGRPAEAEANFHRSLQLGPQSINTMYNLGVLLLDEGKAKEAVTYLERASRAGPPSPDISVSLIRAYLESKQRNRALELAASADRKLQDSASYQLALGRCSWITG